MKIAMGSLALVLPVLPVAAAGAASSGGIAAPGDPQVRQLACVTTAGAPCRGPSRLIAGGQVRVLGSELDASRKVIFRGGRGRGDDVAATARHVGTRHFEARVPHRARSGPVDVVSQLGHRSRAPGRVRVAAARPVDASPSGAYFVGGRRRPSLTVSLPRGDSLTVEVLDERDGLAVRRWNVSMPAGSTPIRWDGKRDDGSPAPAGRYRFRVATTSAEAAVVDDPGAFALLDHIFPIRGRHDLGQSATNNFGGDRDHQGQDMFAACGTRLAAARGGTVKFAGYQERAGNYVVITGEGTGMDYVYMHMRSTPLVRKGERVFTGQKLGEVGDTGNASGCHVHFELWQAPGWYSGGSPMDPLPLLREWDAAS